MSVFGERMTCSPIKASQFLNYPMRPCTSWAWRLWVILSKTRDNQRVSCQNSCCSKRQF